MLIKNKLKNKLKNMNQENYGGGFRTCGKCGKRCFGSSIHHCTKSESESELESELESESELEESKENSKIVKYIALLDDRCFHIGTINEIEEELNNSDYRISHVKMTLYELKDGIEIGYELIKTIKISIK